MNVQVDFLCPDGMKNAILHPVNVFIAFSATQVMPLREASGAIKAIEHIWIKIHGPPQQYPLPLNSSTSLQLNLTTSEWRSSLLLLAVIKTWIHGTQDLSHSTASTAPSPRCAA